MSLEAVHHSSSFEISKLKICNYTSNDSNQLIVSVDDKKGLK